MTETKQHQHQDRAMPREVLRRTLEPMTKTELLVFTRRFASSGQFNENGDEVYYSFSCRTYTKKMVIEYVTVRGLLMPDKDDIYGEPALLVTNAGKYFDHILSLELRSEIRELLSPILNVLENGNVDELTALRAELTN